MRLSRLYLLLRAIPKTVLFNLHYFGWKGLHLPVLVSHRVKLARLSGSVEIPETVATGAIRVGFGNVGIFDQSRSRTLWHNAGRVRFEGRASIGHGSRISVAPTGTITFGAGFSMTAESTLVASRSIAFGAGCLVSWQVLIMDQDFHPLYDENGNRTNDDAPVTLGDRVWIGCRSTILKGTSIPSGSVIAASSTISSVFEGNNLLIAGHPGRIVRSNIHWSLEEEAPQHDAAPEDRQLALSSAIR